MFKILYAAGDRPSSKFNLIKFKQYCSRPGIQLIVSSYSSLGEEADYNLDILLDCLSGRCLYNTKSHSYQKYANWIKENSPNLIISDLEFFTSFAAIEFQIPCWQVSPLLLYYALPKKIKDCFKIHRDYKSLFNTQNGNKSYINYIINNSDRRMILSHFCDSPLFSDISQGYEWVRPDYDLLDEVEKNGYLIDAEINTKNLNIVRGSGYDFYNGKFENYTKYVSDGKTVFLADAFYNQKQVIMSPNYGDMECLLNYKIYEYYGFCKNVNNLYKKTETPDIVINDSVKFLKEYIAI